MMKPEYKVQLTYTEHYSVYVEADSPEEAKKLAIDKYNNNELLPKHNFIDAEVDNDEA